MSGLAIDLLNQRNRMLLAMLLFFVGGVPSYRGITELAISSRYDATSCDMEDVSFIEVAECIDDKQSVHENLLSIRRYVRGLCYFISAITLGTAISYNNQ